MTEATGGALHGTPDDDVLRGEGLRDALFGGEGDDVLDLAGPGGQAWGGEGADRLISGGALRDFLWGEAGDDVFELSGQVYAFGGEGDDVFRLTAAAVGALAVGGAGLDVLELEGPAARYGFRDGVLTRDGGPLVTLAGIEILRFEDGDVAVDALQPSSVSYHPTPDGGQEILASGPGLRLRGTQAADWIRATGADASVRAGAGDDVVTVEGPGGHAIRGGAGDDSIEATGWDVRIDAGRGDDRIAGGFGTQSIDGGAGEDVVDYGRRTMAEFDIEILAPGEARVVRLPAEIDGVAHQWDEVSGVEILRFADGEVRLADAPVRAVGGAGPESLDGGDGADRLAGRGGDDILRGRAGDDRLAGGAGDDALRGGAGDDRIRGGTGDDRLTGGDGADHFVFRPGDGADVIADFDFAEDRLEVRGGEPLAVLDLGRDLLLLGADLSIRIVGGGEDGHEGALGDWSLLG